MEPGRAERATCPGTIAGVPQMAAVLHPPVSQTRLPHPQDPRACRAQEDPLDRPRIVGAGGRGEVAMTVGSVHPGPVDRLLDPPEQVPQDQPERKIEILPVMDGFIDPPIASIAVRGNRPTKIVAPYPLATAAKRSPDTHARSAVKCGAPPKSSA